MTQFKYEVSNCKMWETDFLYSKNHNEGNFSDKLFPSKRKFGIEES